MECETSYVARSRVGAVTVCGCGNVTVHCGNASMRIPRQFFTAFACMVDEAFSSLAQKELAPRAECDGGCGCGEEGPS